MTLVTTSASRRTPALARILDTARQLPESLGGEENNMMLRSIAIALGLLAVSWGCAIYVAVTSNRPAYVSSVEIGEPIILHAEVVNGN